MNDIEALVSISKFAGSRFDLVQAGGGNSSVRCGDGTLLVKASGIGLSEMEEQSGYARVEAARVVALLDAPEVLRAPTDRQRDAVAEAAVKQATHAPYAKASMEIYLHVLLHRLTLHTHPLAVAHLMVRPEAERLAGQLFPDSVFIPYAAPGIALALSIREGAAQYAKRHGALPRRILLANHGLVISGDNAQEVRGITEDTVRAIEAHLGLDYSHYRLATEVMDLLHPLMGPQMVCHVSEDAVIARLFKERPELAFARPAMPDQFVYNGLYPLKLDALAADRVAEFKRQTGEFPKVIAYGGRLLFINRTIRKAREMEEVFKFHLLALSHGGTTPNYMGADDLAFLSNSDAEAYRKLL